MAINNGDDLIALIFEEGSALSETPSDCLSAPVDAADRWLDLHDPNEGAKAIVPQPDDWLPDHEYFDGEDGQSEVEDPELLEQAQSTLRFFIDDERYDPKSPDFEYQFRAYLHNFEYSYPTGLIKRLISEVVPSASVTLAFLK